MALINDPDGLSQGGSTAVAATTFASASGAQIVITSANVPAVTAGDFIEVRDATDPDNDGLYEVDSYSAGVSITASKQALTGAVTNPANDAGSQAIRILGTDANEKNVHFDTTNLKWTLLNGFGSVTVLTNDGATGQAVYSFMKEEWKNDNDLIKFPFPMIAITPEQFEFVEGWTPVDEAESTITTGDASDTRKLLRTAGWSEVDASNLITNQFFGAVTLGTIDASDIAYYFYEDEAAATPFTFDGAVNEAVPLIEGLGNPDTCNFATSSTITRATGSFVTDGYLANHYVLVQNADNAANDGPWLITDVQALTLTVTGTPFTTGADTNATLSLDHRFNLFVVRIRVFGKTYDQSTSTAIGLSEITYKTERFPLSEATDNVIVDLADAETGGVIATLLSNITGGATAPYNDMAVGYFDSPGVTLTGFNALVGDSVPGETEFGVIVDGDAGGAGGGPGSAEQIYAFVQAQLQLATNINDPDARITGEDVGDVIGQLAAPLLVIASTGNTLFTVAIDTYPISPNSWAGGGTGVGIRNFDSNDTNRLTMVDNDGDVRTFPFVAAGTLLFNANLSTDVDAIYRMFFTNDDAGDNLGYDYGTINAITVEDTTPADIAGAVPQLAGGSSLAFTFDYDGNLQRGTGSDATDAPITIVAIGLTTGQYVVATGTITRNIGQTFSLVAALERNFSNP